MGICDLGEDHTADIQEEVIAHLLLENDKALHPWRDWRSSGHNGMPF
jgi:hypothetical protein